MFHYTFFLTMFNLIINCLLEITYIFLFSLIDFYSAGSMGDAATTNGD